MRKFISEFLEFCGIDKFALKYLVSLFIGVGIIDILLPIRNEIKDATAIVFLILSFIYLFYKISSKNQKKKLQQ